MKSYNQRLFDGNSIRSYFHTARFIWLKKAIVRYSPNIKTVIELGCFDGRSISYLPDGITKYDGYDASWEGGLDKAKATFTGSSVYHFHHSESPFTYNPNGTFFDISISLETIEHLASKDLQQYLKKISSETTGLAFISVPNEKGVVLLVKYFLKRIILRQAYDRYTWLELFWVMNGRLDKIKRTEHSHKGFDYDDLRKNLCKHFQELEITGLPFTFLPPKLNFTVALVLKPINISTC